LGSTPGFLGFILIGGRKKIFFFSTWAHATNKPYFLSCKKLENLFKSPPSPEVTELFCQVPSPMFFHRFSILYPSTCVGFYIFKRF